MTTPPRTEVADDDLLRTHKEKGRKQLLLIGAVFGGVVAIVIFQHVLKSAVTDAVAEHANQKPPAVTSEQIVRSAYEASGETPRAGGISNALGQTFRVQIDGNVLAKGAAGPTDLNPTVKEYHAEIVLFTPDQTVTPARAKYDVSRVQGEMAQWQQNLGAELQADVRYDISIPPMVVDGRLDTKRSYSKQGITTSEIGNYTAFLNSLADAAGDTGKLNLAVADQKAAPGTQ